MEHDVIINPLHYVAKHGNHDQSTHAGGRGRGGGGGSIGSATNAKGEKLSAKDDKKLNELAINLFNHKQTVPMSVRTGKMHTPAAQAFMSTGRKIVDQAQAIHGGTFRQAEQELERRLGTGEAARGL